MLLPEFLFLTFLFSAVHAVDVSPSKDHEFGYAPAPQPSVHMTLPFGSHHSKLDEFGYHSTSYDTALLYVINNMSTGITVWAQSDECYKCKLMQLAVVAGNTTEVFYLDTWWAMTLSITQAKTFLMYNSRAALCNPLHQHFGENGNYSLFINLNKSASAGPDSCTCIISTTKQPGNANMPFYVAMGVLALLAVTYAVFNFAYMNGVFSSMTNWCATERVVNSDLGSPPSPQPVTQNDSMASRKTQGRPRRLKSLDTCRGLIIVMMMFGKHGGGGYWFFHHARWNGLTVADLVFPWFIFIMGTSMALSFNSLVSHNTSRWAMVRKIVRRTLILFGLGIILDGGIELSTFRIPGVLQRFALCYLVVASLHLTSAKFKLDEYRITNKYHEMFRDLVEYWHEWLVIIALMVLYVCLVFFLPVPNCPTGYLGPGGRLVGKDGNLTNCTGGATGYIDRLILGEKHLNSRPDPKKVYHTTLNYDPEGILGSIPSIFLTFLGLQAGKILLLHQFHSSRLKRLAIWSLITGGPALLLCGLSKEEGWIPLNKNLWSLSFVLALGGTSFLLLMFCYIMVDMKQWWSGAPFFFAGMNAIILYCGHEILMIYFPFSWAPVYGTHAEMLAMSLLCTSIWVVVSYYMYRMNLYIKI